MEERTPVRSFEDLEVFQKAYRLSLEIHRTSLGLPRHEQFALGDQIRRASKSICANIAEGFGRQRLSAAEYRRFLMLSLGSAEEMRVWCRYCLDLELIEPAVWERWRDGYLEVAKMLTRLHQARGRERDGSETDR